MSASERATAPYSGVMQVTGPCATKTRSTAAPSSGRHVTMETVEQDNITRVLQATMRDDMGGVL